MSNQPRYGGQYHRKHRNEDSAPLRASKEIPRGFQHVPYSPEAASRPRCPSSDYDTPPYQPDESPPSDYDHYEHRSMPKYIPKVRGSNRGPTPPRPRPRHQPQSPALQYRNRSPDPDSDYIAPPGPPSDDDDYIDQRKSTKGVFSDETSNYSNREFSKGRSPDRYSASRDRDGARFIDDTPPRQTRPDRRTVRNSGWDSKPIVVRSRGLKPGKYEDYQEAKQFLERFEQFEAQLANRRNTGHRRRDEYSPERYRDDRSRLMRYNYNDYQEAKQFLERYQKLEAQRAQRSQLEYRRDEEYSPARYRGDSPRRYRNDNSSPVRYNKGDYHEAKEFLERYCTLNAQHARRYEAAHHSPDEDPSIRYRDNDEYTPIRYRDEDSSPPNVYRDEDDYPPIRYRGDSSSPIPYRNAAPSPRRLAARQPSPERQQMPGSFFEETNMYPEPPSDIASQPSVSPPLPPAPFPPAPFPPAPSVPGSDICSMPSLRHGSAYASFDEHSIQAKSTRTVNTTL
ncbi:hypothetical protein PtrSN002B_008490 [Pyrenophora tritici-repentis]|nr:hypothetical protein PtrV1_07118 [Pyrenophora tritici-repentis]KAF7448178.1 hypothetical protein A1F99_075420 [Pyrenophora tritici-repentis]KAI1529823.1 hypothetical protein PtrSN001A_008420 [Pyrenophora tritici-repentis]KAI1531228.1 hypothetical protein PtrSN001C_008397 [Pyrenophora tritici-repentis]KAI1541103.1 hypothetical protein PtrSN002B_008490 [Pyrenophora tritici-repentis]